MDYSSIPDSESFSARFYKMNWEIPRNRRIFIIRTVLIVLSTSFTVYNALTAIILPDGSTDCLSDSFHNATEKLNELLRDDESAKDLCIMVSSGLVDLLLVYFFISWVCFGKSWKPVIALTLFLIARGVVQNLFLSRKPKGYTWENPGVPSITASYRDSDDFFFACSCGLLVIFGLEFYKNKNSILAVICLVAAVMNSFVMIVTRAHYTVDVLAGFVLGHYFWLVGEKLCGEIDKKIGWVDDRNEEGYSINMQGS